MKLWIIMLTFVVVFQTAALVKLYTKSNVSLESARELIDVTDNHADHIDGLRDRLLRLEEETEKQYVWTTGQVEVTRDSIDQLENLARLLHETDLIVEP